MLFKYQKVWHFKRTFLKTHFKKLQTYDVFLGTNLGQFLVGIQNRISKDTVIIPHVTDTVLSDLNKSKS